MENDPSDEIKIPDKYPQKIKDILKDINKIEGHEGKIIRTAYKLAADIHTGQTRKGIEKPDYITHPLIVYDLVNRSIGDKDVADRDVTLAGTILHDVVEDFRKKETKQYREATERIKKLRAKGVKSEIAEQAISGVRPEYARFEASIILRGSFRTAKPPYDEGVSEFVDKILSLTAELTNPVIFKNKENKEISKEEWQADKITKVSLPAKLIKICDQTANIMSNIEEVPDWNLKELEAYTKKALSIVKAANESLSEEDKKSPYGQAIEHASKRFYMVCRESQKIMDDRVARGDPIPAKKPIASYALNVIDEMMRKDRERNPGR